MAGDYTRFTFDPVRGFSGVRMQQGRVQLDADWNELVAILDRRLRAETYDLIGPAGVADRDGATGFKIAWAGTALTIGRGRMYVNGLVAENFGRGPGVEFEPLWGERRLVGDTLYTDQPYRPGVGAAPALSGAGPHMLYLDVWERELTAVDDPRLLEPALGVDTAARTQVVWQVRALAPTGSVNCANFRTNPAWIAETRPSGARLTNGTIAPTEPTQPCAADAVGGYHGRENRLYRVEVHDDTPGAVTWKWSKDNGAVQARIAAIGSPTTQPRLTVDRIGRDPVLRFRRDDWVELIDDSHELAGEPGVMAKIDSTDPATNTIVLTQALPTGGVDPNRNARIRRWEPNPNADSGVIAASNNFVYLGDGIQVRVQVPGGERARTGDHWTFAARVADPQIEPLVDAPPQGIRHHYAPLAVVGSPGASVEDCRPKFPLQPPAPVEGKSCDCDQCVDPESHRTGRLTIQDAIRRVSRRGGKVCLAPGTYVLNRPLLIRGARSVTLVGKGHRTTLVHNGAGPAIDIDRSYEVTIERLAIASASSGLGKYLGSLGSRRPSSRTKPEIGIAMRNSVGVTVERCLIAQSAPFWLKKAASGSSSSARKHVGVGIGLAGSMIRTLVRDCVVFADAGIASLAFGKTTADPSGTSAYGPLSLLRGDDTAETTEARRAAEDGADVLLPESGRESGAEAESPTRRYLSTFDLRIVDNVLACTVAGIDLAGFGGLTPTSALVLHEGDTRVAGNAILGCDRVGIALAGYVGPVEREDARPGAARVDVKDNSLGVTGYGIAIACDNARVCDNDVAILAPGDDGRDKVTGDGIAVGAGDTRPMRGLIVTGNRVGGARAGIMLVAEATASVISDNEITNCARAGIRAVARKGGGLLTLNGNRISDIAVDDRDVEPYGMELLRFDRLDVCDNRVHGVGESAVAAPRAGGIEVIDSRSVRVAGNDVARIGPGEKMAGDVHGIGVVGEFRDVDATDNSVRVGIAASRPDRGGLGDQERYALVIGSDGGGDLPEIGAAPREGDAVEYDGSPIVEEVGIGEVDVAVRGNLLEGNAALGSLRIEAQAAVIASDNRCRTVQRARNLGVTALISTSRTIVATGNTVAGDARLGLALVCPEVKAVALATVTGNIVERGIELNSQPLPMLWRVLNIV